MCLEGQISKESARRSLARGEAPSGDLIPWTVAQQFQDDEFAQLSGARIVRIATHPDVTKMGYGTRAVELRDHATTDEARAKRPWRGRDSNRRAR